MSAGPDTPELLFEWERPARFRWKFFALILLSAVVHLSTFFLFQIVYPPRVTIPPPAPEVSLLLPTTPENRALLRRIEAEDPALIATTPSVTPPDLFQQKYLASYQTVRTQPRTVAAEAPVIRYPAPQDPLTLIRSVAQPAQLASVAPPPVPTRVKFSTALANRAPKEIPAWNFTPRATAPLEPATFLIGLTARGEVRYLFPQRPSGDPALDTQAAAKLPRLDFQKAEAEITWGIATVTWGDDAYGENNPQSAIRHPPSE